MANNYEQSTVSPTLPQALFTELELLTLSAFGMSHEASQGDNLYFYSEDPSWGNDIEINAVMLSDKDNFVVKQYLDYIEENSLKANKDNVFEVNLEEINDDTDSSSELSLENIFQSILNKTSSKEKEVMIMGSFTCDKLRQGEFGGFVTRITKDSIQHSGTYQMLEQMRHPETIRLAVVMEGGLVQAVVSNKPENLSVVTIDYETDGCDEIEVTQVKQSDGSYSDAICINECITEPVIDLDEVFGESNGSCVNFRCQLTPKVGQFCMLINNLICLFLNDSLSSIHTNASDSNDLCEFLDELT